MAMTAAVKDELSRVDVPKPCCRRSEMAALLRFAGGLPLLASGGRRRASHYIVRVVKDGEALARQTGLLDVRGRPVRGLPPHVVSANACCAVAAWRGAFLAHGSRAAPAPPRARRRPRLPGCGAPPPPGRAPGGPRAAPPRRIGVAAKAREVRG